MVTETFLHCPNCYQMDGVQKVSAIVSAGTASGVYAGFGNGVGYTPNGPVFVNDYMTLSGNSQTSLSRLLSPPPQPTYNRSWSWWSTMVVTISSIVLSLTLLYIFIIYQILANNRADIYYQDDIQVIIHCVIIGFVCIGVISSVYTMNRQAINRRRAWAVSQVPHWQRAVNNWNYLYYCHRCDGVFYLGQSYLVPSAKMMDFIYKI